MSPIYDPKTGVNVSFNLHSSFETTIFIKIIFEDYIIFVITMLMVLNYIFLKVVIYHFKKITLPE